MQLLLAAHPQNANRTSPQRASNDDRWTGRHRAGYCMHTQPPCATCEPLQKALPPSRLLWGSMPIAAVFARVRLYILPRCHRGRLALLYPCGTLMSVPIVESVDHSRAIYGEVTSAAMVVATVYKTIVRVFVLKQRDPHRIDEDFTEPINGWSRRVISQYKQQLPIINDALRSEIGILMKGTACWAK